MTEADTVDAMCSALRDFGIDPVTWPNPTT